MSDHSIGLDDLRPDVVALVAAHRLWAAEHSPAEDVHALEPEALADPQITLLTARAADGELWGMVALRELQPDHGEIKTMRVTSAARGRGVGRALLLRVLALARERRYSRVSLETGTMEAFASARRLYASVGFTPCPPFGSYTSTENSVCMTLALVPHP
ncbi:MAG: family N-acetyltransferase [Frankiales bacterium]|nr:family N-acetyltransferase [Frankiales bacterium]